MKNKKLVIFIGLFISLFLIFIFLYNLEFNYEYEYEINEYIILESYDKDTSYYSFVVDDYNINILGNYSTKRGLITDVSIDDNCINIVGTLDFYPICIVEDNYYFSNVEYIENYTESYENLMMYDLNELSYFIWDYNGFIYLTEEISKKIEIFETEVYYPTLIKQIDNYLFIPNYDENYYFSSYILLDMEKGTYKEIEIDSEINFDFEYISYDEKYVTVYDKKNEKVYKIKYSNGDTEKKLGITYTDVELSNIIFNEYEYFSIDNEYLLYSLSDYNVYLSDYLVDDILFETSESVIFLSNGDLYYFELGSSINKVISYSEWKFNYENQIFIY